MNTLLLLPLKFRSGWRGPFAVGGFSAGKWFQSGDIAASTGALGRTNCRDGADILDVVLVVMMAVVLMVMLS